MKSVLILGTTLATTFATTFAHGPEAGTRETSRHLTAVAWDGGLIAAAASCQFRPMTQIFHHVFSGNDPTVSTGTNIYYASNSTEATQDPNKDEAKRYPMLVAEWSNKLKLTHKVENEATYQYYIFNESSTNTHSTTSDGPREDDWEEIENGGDECDWHYCAYRTGNAGDGTSGYTPGSPDGNGRYECGQNMCTDDMVGQDGTGGKKNCQDLTQLGSYYIEEADYDGTSDQKLENEVHVDTGTWSISERVTVGVSTHCGSTAQGATNNFAQKSHIFAWATLSSTADYTLATQETDTDHGTAEVAISAIKKTHVGKDLIWIHGDTPGQQTQDITAAKTDTYTFAFSGSLTDDAETSVETSCAVLLTVSNSNGDYGKNCFDSPNNGNYVDGPAAGACKASMTTTCTRITDSNAEGTDIFDHAALTDTRKWDVRIDSAIVQAILVTNSRRINANTAVTAADLMDMHNELNDVKFNVDCNGDDTDAPCTPWQTNAASQSYPSVDKYACNGDCATTDPFVVLSGFYDHKMTVTCPGITSYDQETTCHLTGGDDIATTTPHQISHLPVNLLMPPGTDPLFYVFGIANFGAPLNERVTDMHNRGVVANRRLRSALSKDVKLGGGIISTVAPHRNSIRAN